MKRVMAIASPALAGEVAPAQAETEGIFGCLVRSLQMIAQGGRPPPPRKLGTFPAGAGEANPLRLGESAPSLWGAGRGKSRPPPPSFVGHLPRRRGGGDG